MLQPGRKMYEDLTSSTFDKHLEVNLSKDNILYKVFDGNVTPAFLWALCLEYEHHIRKEAIRLCREEDWSIPAALWFTHKNQVQWMKDWVETLSLANRSSCSAGPAISSLTKNMAESHREVAGLERSLQAVTGRACSSPREGNQKQNGLRHRHRHGQRAFASSELGEKGTARARPRNLLQRCQSQFSTISFRGPEVSQCSTKPQERQQFLLKPCLR